MDSNVIDINNITGDELESMHKYIYCKDCMSLSVIGMEEFHTCYCNKCNNSKNLDLISEEDFEKLNKQINSNYREWEKKKRWEI